MSTYEPRQLFNFIQGSDISGESSYDIWKALNPEGTETEFLEYIQSGPKGEQGESAYSYYLAVSDTVMKRDMNNSLLPASITFNGYYRIGIDATRHEYAGKFIIQETVDGSDWETKYSSSANEVSVIYTPSNADVKIIKCTLYSAGESSIELDTQSVVILTDISGLEVGARNLLSGSDIHYELTKDSNAFMDVVPVVNAFDLQRLIDKNLILSYYADTMGSYVSAGNSGNDRFGMYASVVWVNSTNNNTQEVNTNPIAMSSVGVDKQRVSMLFNINAPEGYDKIESIEFIIDLSLKPESDGVWVFERPKLEIGNVSTEWTIAPEDVEAVVAVLSNDAHTIATDSNGNGGSFDDCFTSIQVFSGYTDVTAKSSFEVVATDGLTGNWDLTNYTYSVTGLSVDNGYVDITATYRGFSVTKRFTVTKSKSGKSAYEIWLDAGNIGTEEDFINSVGRGYTDEKIAGEVTARNEAISNSLEEAKSYTNAEIAALVNGAPETMDTLKELSDLMSSSAETIDTLNEAISKRALKTDLDTKVNVSQGTEYSGQPLTVNEEGNVVPKSVIELNEIVLKDIENGHRYIVQMKNGTLVSICACVSIAVTTSPNKTSYVEGEEFDPTGMVVTAACEDGTTREISNYQYNMNLIDNTVTISYTERGVVYTTSIAIN